MKSNFQHPHKKHDRATECPELAVEIGARIRKIRVAAKISQGYVAKKIGVHQSVLCNIEIGQNCPSVSKLIPLADALSCSLDYIVLGIEPGAGLQAKLNEANREIERLRSALDNVADFAKQSKKS